MTRVPFAAGALAATAVAVVNGITFAAQDRFTLKVPDGLAFSEFKGYDNWEPVSVSRTEDGLKVIAANPAMMEAFRNGVPSNGQPFPEGSKIAKIEWSEKKNSESPYFVMVPDVLRSVSFIEKDTRRFESSGGWGYAQYRFDAASDAFAPSGSGSACGYACHTAVKAKDFIFTTYPRR